jgi:hypothetical protein
MVTGGLTHLSRFMKSKFLSIEFIDGFLGPSKWKNVNNVLYLCLLSLLVATLIMHCYLFDLLLIVHVSLLIPFLFV